MWKLSVALLVVVVCICSVNCNIVSLSVNGVRACAPTCTWEDTSIWSTGALPAAADEVHLVFADLNLSNTSLTINAATRVEIAVLVSLGVHVNLLTAANFTVHNSTTTQNAALDVHGNLYSGDITTVSANVTVTGNLYVNPAKLANKLSVFSSDSRLSVSGLYWSASTTALGALVETTEGSSFQVVDPAAIVLTNTDSVFLNEPSVFTVTLAGDSFTFAGGLQASVLALSHNTSVDIHKQVEITNQVVFADATSKLNLLQVGYVAGRNNSYIGRTSKNSLSGTGEVLIYSSNVTIHNSEQASLNCTFVVDGNNSYVDLENIIIDKQPNFLFGLDFVSAHWELTNVAFNARASLFGEVTLKGPITVTESVAFLTADYVPLVSGTLLVRNSTLTAKEFIVGSGATVTLDQGASLQVYDAYVEPNGNFAVGNNLGYRNGQYVPVVLSGDLWNGGVVTVTQHNLLSVYGDYIQNTNATLRVEVAPPSHPVDANATATALWVRDNARLNSGYLQILVKSATPDSNFHLLLAQGSINGSFHTVTVDNSAVAGHSIGNFDVQYQNNTIVLKYTPAPPHEDGFWDGPWPGIIFGVAGALIVAAVVALIVWRYRKKKQYQAIP